MDEYLAELQRPHVFSRTIDDGFPWIGEIIPFSEAESDLDLRMGEYKSSLPFPGLLCIQSGAVKFGWDMMGQNVYNPLNAAIKTPLTVYLIGSYIDLSWVP